MRTSSKLIQKWNEFKNGNAKNFGNDSARPPLFRSTNAQTDKNSQEIAQLNRVQHSQAGTALHHDKIRARQSFVLFPPPKDPKRNAFQRCCQMDSLVLRLNGLKVS